MWAYIILLKGYAHHDSLISTLTAATLCIYYVSVNITFLVVVGSHSFL